MADVAPLRQPFRSAGFADLRTRLLSALVLGAAAVGSLLLGGVAFVLFWLVAALVVQWEWQRMIGSERRLLRTVVGAAAICFATGLGANLEPDLAGVIVLVGAAVAAAIAAPGQRLASAAGVVYAGILIIAVITIRPALATPLERPFDVRTIVWLFAVVWGTDVFAYFAGRLIGGPKVWPAVSPGKTWSGTLVGIVCGAVAGLLVALIRPVVPIAPVPVLLVGLVAAAAAQAGDFFESGVKRRYDVKDSSNLIPGHGGAMDRLDGFIAAAGVVVLLHIARDASSVGEAVFRW